jgi:hypothetical protein
MSWWASAWRGIKRTFKAPSVGQAPYGQAVVNAHPFAQLNQFLFRIPVHDKSRAAAVARLHRGRGPAAILRRIWALVVNPIKAVPRAWASAHIGQKHIVGVAPSCANRDAAAPIFRVRGRAPILASVDHRLPGAIFRRAPAFTVCPVGAWLRSAQTTTTARGTFADISGQGGGVASTPAPADGMWSLPGKDGQVTVRLPYSNHSGPSLAPNWMCYHDILG